MTDYSKGGRGQKAPYQSTHCRIPEPIKPVVEQLATAYRQLLGNGRDAEELLKRTEDAITEAYYPSDDKPVNGFKSNAEVGKELVQEYLKSLGLETIPIDDKNRPKARYDQLSKFVSWLDEKSEK